MATIYETFWDHVDKSSGPSACWPWMRARVPRQSRAEGSTPRGGYGSLAVPGKLNQQGAHRVAYELTNGSIPTGAVVRHSCDNPPCCNPLHLTIGTPADNRRDCIERGRVGDTTPHDPVRGEDQHAAKFTDESMFRMRQERLAGAGWPELAARYGVSTSTIQAAGKGRTWKHVPMPEGDQQPVRRQVGRDHYKLNESIVRKILEARSGGAKLPYLAARFGVSQSTIWSVIQRETWAHVD